MNPARLQNGIQPLHRYSGVTDGEAFHFEAELRRARFGAEDEFAVEARGRIGSFGFVEIDRREYAAECGATRPPEFRHERAGERITAVAGVARGFFDAHRCVWIHARRTAERIGNRGARESKDLGKGT